MRHEELLREIQVCFGEDYDEWMDRKSNALRAVVELHKPVYGENAWDSTINWLECPVCFTEGDLVETSSNIDYPCPTIQAIEKALTNGN